jgi:hypothetical protein
MLAAAQGEFCNQIPAWSAHRGLLERALHPDPARRPSLPTVQGELDRWLGAIGQRPDDPVTERLRGPIPPRTTPAPTAIPATTQTTTAITTATTTPTPAPDWPTEEQA